MARPMEPRIQKMTPRTIRMTPIVHRMLMCMKYPRTSRTIPKTIMSDRRSGAGQGDPPSRSDHRPSDDIALVETTGSDRAGEAAAQRPAAQHEQHDGERQQHSELGQDVDERPVVPLDLGERLGSPGVWGHVRDGAQGVREELERVHRPAKGREHEAEPLVLAALGGAMYPLEFFPDTLRTVAHV